MGKFWAAPVPGGGQFSSKPSSTHRGRVQGRSTPAGPLMAHKQNPSFVPWKPGLCNSEGAGKVGPEVFKGKALDWKGEFPGKTRGGGDVPPHDL